MTQGVLFEPSLRWPAGPRLVSSYPANVRGFSSVWKAMGGRLHCRGYVGSCVDEFPRRFMAWEIELGDRVALDLQRELRNDR